MKAKKIKKILNFWESKLFIATFLIFGLIFQISLNTVISTMTVFNSAAKITDIVYQTGSLDLTLSSTNLGQVFLDEETTLNVEQAGDLAFQYQLKVETDDNDFCAGLILTATSSVAGLYANQLQTFTATSTMLSDLADSWQYKISDPLHRPAGQTCNFKFIFQAWQTSKATYDPLAGFSDVAVATGSVNSGSGTGGAECVRVTVPNGGETWWVGRTHEIDWETNNPAGPNDDLKIDIYYSHDSGHSWGLVKKDASNIGSYFWRVSLLLENNTYWVPSPTARIKLVAHYGNGEICGWDMSDEDYCPPIEYDLLTPEELAWLSNHGLQNEVNPISFEPSVDPTPAVSTSPTTEIGSATTTEQTLEPDVLLEQTETDPMDNMSNIQEPVESQNFTQLLDINENGGTADKEAPICLETPDVNVVEPATIDELPPAPSIEIDPEISTESL